MTLLVSSPAQTRRPKPGGRRRAAVAMIVVVVLAAAAIAAVLANGSGSASQPAALSAAARRSAATFLDNWVDADGRVVRHDQGGDTVSEGQAYGLLVALWAGDRTRFDAIWAWTRTHLQNSDGTLSWQWSGGSVTDEQPASDADTDAATALLLAARTWHDGAYQSAGKRLAAATLRTSTVPAAPGLLLAAGPWATGRDGGTVYVDPDYLVAGTATRLADLTGDRRWNEVAAANTAMDTALLRATALPPDWVTLAPGKPAAQVVATAAPGAGGTPTYGLSAPRLLIRLATSCDAADRQLVGRLGPTATRVGAVAIRSLAGAGQVTWQHPLTDVAAAAVLAERGQNERAQDAMSAAGALQSASPTYYGAAWLALGSALLSANRPTGCTEAPIA